MTTPKTDLDGALRAWARGDFAAEAAVDLLLWQNRVISPHAPWINVQSDYAAIDPDRLANDVAGLSGGERRVVAIAASLLGGPPVDLRDALGNLDDAVTRKVLAALSHACGF